MCSHLLRATSCCVVLLSLQCSCFTSPVRTAHPTPTPMVHFIVPAGFNGPFLVAASDRQPHGPFTPNSRHEFRIPADGVLVVEDNSVLYTWHTTEVSTDDGTLFQSPPRPVYRRNQRIEIGLPR